MPGYIRGEGCFRSIKISLNFDKIVFNRRFVDPIIFRHLKLEIALAIPASNDEKYN